MEELKQLLEKEWNVHATKITLSTQRSINKHYYVEAQEGEFFLKAQGFLKASNKKGTLNSIHIANHLAKKGVEVIQAIETVNKEQVVSYAGLFYSLYPKITIDAPEKTTDKMLEAARVLTDFHLAMKDFDKEIAYPERPLHKDIDAITCLTEYPYNYRKEPIITMLKNNTSKFAKRVKEDLPILYKAIVKVVHFMWRAEYSMETIVHYDCNPANVFFDDGKLVAISDFELSHKGYIETDVVKAAKFWSENIETGEIDVRKFKYFVYHYKKGNPKLIVNWDTFHAMTLFIVLRRLLYAVEYTIDGRGNLEFLYDIDIKLTKWLMKNNFHEV